MMHCVIGSISFISFASLVVSFDVHVFFVPVFQSAANSSALFLTAAAQNLLCLKLAQELGVAISNPWVSWFKAASVPAFTALLTTPLLLYKIFPPEIKETPEAPAAAEKKLQAMGPITPNEWYMVSTMLLAVTLWVFGYVPLYHFLCCFTKCLNLPCSTVPWVGCS
jgi:di/tricarboxylate transporter